MKPAPRRWEVAEAAALPGHPAVLGRVLAARGYDGAAARELLDTGTAGHPDPFLLTGMPEAVIALGVAVRERQRIAVYGDYDADGVTACAMLTLALRAAGAVVQPYIPNRMTEGYGLHAAALEELGRLGVQLAVTVDCGTSSVEVVQGRPQGMRLVITDHHLPLAPEGSAPRLAPADALINPKQPGDTYPFDALAGAGVAWKLLQALEMEGVVPEGSAAQGLGLAALGTVADMMPLRGENRLIVARGLAQLSRDPSPGIRALCAAAGIRSAALRASDIAFGLAPRINAAGRMEDAELALRLCLAEDEGDAEQIAAQLEAQNQVRREAVAVALAQAEERIAELPDDLPAIVLGDPGWPMGIVGLVAGRITEKYARPSFVACLDAEEAKGSARSIRGVHVVKALDAAAPALLRYGGHALAAGFSLDPARFEEFAALLLPAVAAQVGEAPPERVFRVDAVVTAGELVPELCRELDALEPCGQGNHEALLAMRDCTVLAASSFGATRQHLRVLLRDEAGGLAEAIAFNKPGVERHLPRGRRIDCCFGLELDEWDGRERVRMRLRDLRPAAAAEPIAVAETPVAVAATA
ncbi:MAG TPA: single-stranded-DNA-specific exonuclease RecJ [Candidatus Dormibacteraeota bacterium]|nr:single-stranded-DNA-specific exonuclease RecJ [Candidatus Dormibacteraeota bacterium]